MAVDDNAELYGRKEWGWEALGGREHLMRVMGVAKRDTWLCGLSGKQTFKHHNEPTIHWYFERPL
ncbi:hypothetical protein A8O14_07475 [Polynucleobacter wuianus]|uniref:Uncharacterized protein n=1 Tax=Polynucleobacter wuianus TaxID=1743168 RepID=A0A191UG93_9BURK|nr:hypothetical protein A8O14_07475 [Polynucleobacter wuianus]